MALYQGARSRGLAQEAAHQDQLGQEQERHDRTAWTGRPQATSSADDHELRQRP